MKHGCSLALLLLAGCTADVAPAVVSLPATPAPPAIEDALVRISARNLADTFKADGDLGEWGALEPPPPPEKKPAPGKKAGPSAAAPKPASDVVVGLGASRVGIAAELRKASRDGVWIAIQFPVNELGALGSFQRGGGVSPDQCRPQNAETPGDDPTVAKCLDDLETAHRDYNTQFTARFQHTYRIDKSGVRVLAASKLVAIPGAKFVAKEKGDAIVIEAELPLAALPRVAEAPVASIGVTAMNAKGEPKFADGSWIAGDLAEPVTFAPNGPLRNAVFGDLRSDYFRFHYQPGDTLELAVTGYGSSGNDWSFDASRYEERAALIFTPQQTFAGFKVGYVYPVGLATLEGDTFVELAKTNGDPLGMAVRDGDLHAFFFEHYTSTDDWREHGKWSVLAVDGKGAVSERNVERPQMESVTKMLGEYHQPDFSSFGYDAEQSFGDGQVTIEHRTWKWDSKQKAYVYAATVTKKRPPPKTKKR